MQPEDTQKQCNIYLVFKRRNVTESNNERNAEWLTPTEGY